MTNDIGTRAVRGVAWLGAGQVVRQLIALAANIALARLLFPDDFGLFGMAFAAIEIAQILTDFGLGSALIQRQESNPITLTTCFWLNIAVGITVAGVTLAASPLLISYFGRPEIGVLLVPLALNMLLGSGLVVPTVLLTQRLMFRELTIAQIAGSIAASIGAVSLAVGGLGVWALALQPLIGNIVTGIGVFAQAKWMPRERPKLSSVSGMLAFSGSLLGQSIVSAIGRNLQAFIIGRQLGGASLGLYGIASGLTGTIIFQVSSVIVRVLFPTLSSLQGDPDRLRAAWFKATSAIAVVACPSMLGMNAVAPDLMVVVFGPQWLPAAGVLQVLTVAMAIQSVLTTSGTILMSLGRADLLFKVSLPSVVASGGGLWIGAPFGIEGAAIGYVAASILTSFLIAALACNQTHTKVIALVRELMPWLVCSTAMWLGVVVTGQALAPYSPALRLSITIATGAVLYSVLLVAMARQRTLALLGEVRSRLGKQREDEVAPSGRE